jgi:hypothetical protein
MVGGSPFGCWRICTRMVVSAVQPGRCGRPRRVIAYRLRCLGSSWDAAGAGACRVGAAFWSAGRPVSSALAGAVPVMRPLPGRKPGRTVQAVTGASRWQGPAPRCGPPPAARRGGGPQGGSVAWPGGRGGGRGAPCLSARRCPFTCPSRHHGRDATGNQHARAASAATHPGQPPAATVLLRFPLRVSGRSTGTAPARALLTGRPACRNSRRPDRPGSPARRSKELQPSGSQCASLPKTLNGRS